uniref:Ribonuclease H-like domain-containing protein n=1 Tax=Tanacetum cinerariifolium TaxID=118510 RepID=A0A6L2JZ84_TANCI|nr:ribonuclease H-like domain-containing protein [Tanacetum cinerariifolium]
MVEKNKLDEDLHRTPVDAILYRGMIGSLMYLTSSRTDLIYAVLLGLKVFKELLLFSQERFIKKGINKWYQILLEALLKKNYLYVQDLFKKMEAQPEITQNISSLKLPMLKTGDYDLWSMRMEQYLTHTDYALWEVIINGESPVPEAPAVGTVVPLKIKAQKLARKNELKAKSTLLLAILDEYLLKFHSIKDAKSFWEAIKICQSNTLQLDNEDLEQIDTDDLEEMDLKWQVAMIIMRVKKIMKKTGRNLNFKGKEPVGFDKTRVECYNYNRRGHFAREFHAPRNQGNRSSDNERRVVPVETPVNALVVQDGLVGYDWSYQAEEGPTDFALIAHSSDSANSSNSKTGLGYDSQLIKNEMSKCEIFEAASDSNVSEIDEDSNQEKDREVRPVWNNARRVKHQNFSKITHPHSKRNFVPTAFATKSRHVLVNTAKQSSTTSTSTARPKINTAAIRPNVNVKSFYFKSHSPKRRHFNQKSATKTNTFSRKINTAKRKNVTTVEPKAIVNTAEGKKENAIKSSACWNWRPKGKLVDHTSKYNGSYTLKRFNYVNDQEQIQSLADKKKVIITEDIIRSDIRFDGAKGTACLLNEAIFEGLTRMRFLQVFLDKQVEGMARHKEMYIISSHTKKIFANMRRIGAGVSGKKQNPRRKQMKEAEVSNDESEDKDNVLTPSSDPLPSGEDSFILNELMVFCTILQEHVLDLQEAKAAQIKEVDTLKKKVTKLNKWRKSRSEGLRRLKKFGSGRIVKPPMEKDSLGAQEDTSKQGRMIKEIDLNAEIALANETQGRKNDDEMFGVNDLAREEVVMDTTTGEHEEQIIEDVSTAKPVTTAGEVVTTTNIKDSAALITYDKYKAKMIKPEVPIKKKDQMRINEENARKLEAEEQEAARLSRAQQDEEANNSWDNIQAMMDANRLLAKRLQAREREELY